MVSKKCVSMFQKDNMLSTLVPDAKSRLTGKEPDAGKDWGQEEKGVAEDDMVR